MCQGGKPATGKFHSSYTSMNVCGSAYENACVVDGTCAIRQRIEYYIYYIIYWNRALFIMECRPNRPRNGFYTC